MVVQQLTCFLASSTSLSIFFLFLKLLVLNCIQQLSSLLMRLTSLSSFFFFFSNRLQQHSLLVISTISLFFLFYFLFMLFLNASNNQIDVSVFFQILSFKLHLYFVSEVNCSLSTFTFFSAHFGHVVAVKTSLMFKTCASR